MIKYTIAFAIPVVCFVVLVSGAKIIDLICRLVFSIS